MQMWRMILSGAGNAFFNMALDEALLISCQKGTSPPVLRLYRWNPPAVSIGYSQPAGRAVDFRKCQERGIEVVRRITGGRAVLHDDEITYSVCASSSDFPQLGTNVGETYQKLSMALLESLRFLGIKGEWVRPSSETKLPNAFAIWSAPCFLSSSRYELTVAGKKLIGSAQRRFSIPSGRGVQQGFIQHGSIPIGKGRWNMAELLPNEGPNHRLRKDLLEKSTYLQEVLGRELSLEEMAQAVKCGFEKIFDCRMKNSTVTDKELEMAMTLSRETYSSDRWNLRR